MDITVEKMKDKDWVVVQSIYRQGITTGNATFETDVPEWREWDKNHLRDCRLVAKSGDNIVGWMALSPVSNRCVYRGVAEVSLYIKSSAREQVTKREFCTKWLANHISSDEKPEMLIKEFSSGHYALDNPGDPNHKVDPEDRPVRPAIWVQCLAL